MTHETEPKLNGVAPVFMVTDTGRAARYYVDALAFKIAFEWADEEGGAVTYVILRKDDCDLHLSKSPTEHKTTAYFFMGGIDAYYAAVNETGAIIAQELKDWPWGMREFEVTDPDGNRMIFGESVSEE